MLSGLDDELNYRGFRDIELNVIELRLTDEPGKLAPSLNARMMLNLAQQIQRDNPLVGAGQLCSDASVAFTACIRLI